MKKAKMLSKLKKMTGPTRLPVEEKPVLMKGQIAANVLNIRAKASTDSDVVGKLKKNDIVEIIGIGEQWYEIHHNDGNAFVFAKFVEPLLKTGRVNANKLNIRSLPNLDAEKIGLLTADKKIIIVDEIDGWYKIKYKESFGYVFGKFIEITADKPGKTFLFQDPQLLTIPIEPAKKVEVTGNRIQQIVREAYNKYGNLLSHLSNKLGLELAASVAVLSVESGGVGIEKGRALIRFENHLFYKYWGKFNEAKYRQHFQFASGKNWLGHKFRKDPDGEWIDFHGDQDKEYEALNFARSLDDEKALLSISMGLPQILGSNSKLIGYDSVQEMFENFNKDIRYHIFALFDFFSPRMIKYLKGREFVNFAKYYNGQGQARRYGKFIQDYYEAFPKNLG
jgi:hypothetical protein